MADKKDQAERFVMLTIRVTVPVIKAEQAEALEQVIVDLVAGFENVRYDATRSIPRPGRE